MQKKIITLEHLLGSSHLSTVFRCTLSSFRYTSCNTSVKREVHKKCSLKAIRFYTMRIGLGYNEFLCYDQSWICMSSCMLVHIHMEQLLTLLLPFIRIHETTCNMLNRFPKNVWWRVLLKFNWFQLILKMNKNNRHFTRRYNYFSEQLLTATPS